MRSRRTARRIALSATALASLVALTGCSQATLEQWGRWGMLEPASDRAPFIGNLWDGAWIASMVIGVFVWGLIGYVLFRFRRRDDREMPRQIRYNLPLEILYTLVPFLIIGVLFFFTVQSQNAVLAKEADEDVHVVDVVGQKWSWTFNYREADNPDIGTDAHTVGTIEEIPTLVLPVDEPVRFNLESADVIHSFWIPDFYFKLDVVPGLDNSFDVTPTKEGTFLGKCAELCGTYHAAMVFHVEVVSVDEYNAHVRELAAAGNTGLEGVPAFPGSGPRTEG